MQNTVGIQDLFSPKMTPPTPCPDASLIPAKSGQPETNSVHFVGAMVDSHRRVWESLNVVSKLWLRLRNTNGGYFLKILLHGENKPFPAGIEMKAYHSFEITDRNRAHGMPHDLSLVALIHLWRIVRKASHFGCSSQSVFSTLLKVKPRMSLCRVHMTSSFSNFLRKRGSSSSFYYPLEKHHEPPQ